MKRVLIAIAAVLVLIIAAILILPGFVDWNDYREEIASQIESATGRRVTIDGDVSFSALPSPALSIADMRIANLPGATSVDVVTLGSLDIGVALFPLLSGAVQVEEIVLVDPVIDLEVLPDGRRNWVFGDEAPAEAEQGEGSLDISVDRFLVSNGTVLYRSGPGEVQQFDGLDLEISARSLSGPFEVSGELAVNEVPFALTVTVGRVDAARTPVKLEFTTNSGQAAGVVSGHAVLGEGEPSLDGDIDFSARNLNALLADMDYQEAGPGLTAAPVELTAKTTADASQVAFDAMTVTLGDISGKGGASYSFAEEAEFKVLLNLAPFDLDKAMGQDASQDGSRTGKDDESTFPIPQDLRGTAEITAGSITYSGGIIRQVRAAASLADGELSIGSLSALLPGGSDLAFSGKAVQGADTPELSGKLRLGSSSLRGLLTWLGVTVDDVPTDRLAQLSLDTSLHATPSLIRLHEVDLSVDTTKITGAFAYALQDRTSFSADLAADRINLDAYLGADDRDDDGSLDETLSVLGDFDTKFRLAVERLTYERTPLGGVIADLALVDGVLTVNRLSATDLAGATLSVKGTGENFDEASSWDLSLEANTSKAGGLLGFLGIEPPTTALGDGPLTLAATLAGPLNGAELTLDGKAGATTLVLSGESEDFPDDDRKVNLRLDLANPSWAALARQIGLEDLQPVEGHDGAANIRGTLVGAASAYQVNLEASAAGAAITVNGDITDAETGTSYALAIGAKGDDVVKLVRGLGRSYMPASEGLGGFDISASVNGSPEQVNIQDLSAKLGPSQFSGQVAVDLSGGRPLLEAELSAQLLDMDLFLEERDAGPRLVRAPGGQRWSSEPIGLEFLRDFDARIVLSAEELRYHRYNFDEPTMTLALTSGVMRLENLSGFLFGGQVVLSGTLDVSLEPVFTLDIDLKGASVAQALQTAADIQSATGTFTLSGKFAGHGPSEAAIVSNLRGQGDFEARDGVIRGFDLPQLSQQMLSLVEYDDFLSLANIAFDGGETAYTLITAPMTVQNGVSQTRDGRAELAEASGTIDADVNLPRWTMDAELEFHLTDPEHRDTPPAGVRYYGDIDAPRQETRISALSSHVGSKLIGRVLQDVVGEGDQEGGALQQLLGGSQGAQGQDGGETQEGPAANPMDQLFRGIMNQVRRGREQE